MILHKVEGRKIYSYFYAENYLHIDILGISPCNDEQLYIRLWQNTKLRACNYFYYERKDAVEIRKHIKGMLERHITDRDVKRFWASFK